MLVKIITCPKCLKRTLIIVATSSTVTKKCSECDFVETMLIADYRKQKEKKQLCKTTIKYVV